jgi:hypothetical protein
MEVTKITSDDRYKIDTLLEKVPQSPWKMTPYDGNLWHLYDKDGTLIAAIDFSDSEVNSQEVYAFQQIMNYLLIAAKEYIATKDKLEVALADARMHINELNEIKESVEIVSTDISSLQDDMADTINNAREEG